MKSKKKVQLSLKNNIYINFMILTVVSFWLLGCWRVKQCKPVFVLLKYKIENLVQPRCQKKQQPKLCLEMPSVIHFLYTKLEFNQWASSLIQMNLKLGLFYALLAWGVVVGRGDTFSTEVIFSFCKNSNDILFSYYQDQGLVFRGEGPSTSRFTK